MVGRVIQMGWRQGVLLVAMLTFSSLIVRNLYYWQVTEHARIVQVAARVYDSLTNVPASRGRIYDTNLAPLVDNVTAYVVAADPADTPLPKYNAAKLARVLHRDPGPIYARLLLPHTQYVVIARQVDQATANAIRALGLKGVILEPSYRAVYPESIAAPVLGFVNEAGAGQYGLEEQYNRVLTGRDGSQLVFVDTANRPLPVGVQKPRAAISGASLVLTLDSRIQAVVERRLAAALQRYGAESGTAIVMDPRTGAILAMASLPSFDPNHYNRVTSLRDFDNLTLSSYQPGSTFKITSISAGLDSNAFTPRTTVYDPGFYRNYGITVHNWEVGTGWQWETPEKMLRYSANVGMAQFANMMRPTTFYHYVTDQFGFNAPTGIDLPGESPGHVRTPLTDPLWQMMDLLTNSYGQGIDVTPLQLTTAMAALANGGWRMRPYLVKSIIYPAEAHRAPWIARPQRVVRAVSPATAAAMTQMLRRSAEDGEATCALTNNYPVAAKTGTATIEGPSAHGLDLTGGTVASLIGFAPVDDPRFVMLVTIRRPRPGPNNNHIWGSVVAAPAWHDIALSLYRIMGIAPRIGSTSPRIPLWQGPTDWSCAFMAQ